MVGNQLSKAQQQKIQQRFSQLGAAMALLSFLLAGIYIQNQEAPPTLEKKYQPQEYPLSSPDSLKPGIKNNAPIDSLPTPRKSQKTNSNTNFSNFTSTHTPLGPRLQWKSPNQQIQKYLLERSADGITYEVIQSIKNNTNQPLHSLIDTTSAYPCLPLIFYRIKAVNSDGSYFHGPSIPFKKELGLGLYLEVISIKRGKISLLFASDQKAAPQLEVLSAKGQILESRTLSSSSKATSITLDVQNWQQNPAWLRLSSNGTSLSQSLKIPSISSK